jgi:hypothetical protein
MSFWGTAQIPTGFLIICLPSVPRAVQHFGGQSWFLRLESGVRSLLHVSPPKCERQSGNVGRGRVPTIGGGAGAKRPVVSDIESESLVDSKSGGTGMTGVNDGLSVERSFQVDYVAKSSLGSYPELSKVDSGTV